MQDKEIKVEDRKKKKKKTFENKRERIAIGKHVVR